MNLAELSKAVERLRARIPSLRAVYLYGSRSRMEDWPASDIDIAFYAGQPLDSLKRYDLAAELADLLSCDVDLVDMAAASTVMRSQIIGRGRRLFGEADPALEEFESRVFSDYARLNEERAAILEGVRESGSVYGG